MLVIIKINSNRLGTEFMQSNCYVFMKHFLVHFFYLNLHFNKIYCYKFLLSLLLEIKKKKKAGLNEIKVYFTWGKSCNGLILS